MLNKLKEVKKEMCNCTLRWPRFLCATEPNESLNIGKDFNSDRIALVHQHVLRLLFRKRKCPVAVACVGSVPVRAERNIGPRKEVFLHLGRAKNGAKAIHVIVNWQLSKQAMRWPVLRDHIEEQIQTACSQPSNNWACAWFNHFRWRFRPLSRFISQFSPVNLGYLSNPGIKSNRFASTNVLLRSFSA